MQNFLGLGAVATAIGLILTVWAWKMNAHSANWMLVVAWALFTVSVYASIPVVAKQPILPRVLWTMLIAAIIGLVLYGALWTPTDKEQPVQETRSDGIPNVVPLFVECRHSAPPRSPDPDGRMNVVLLEETDKGPLAHLLPPTNLGPGVFNWEHASLFPLSALECKLTNDLAVPLSRVVVSIVAGFKEVTSDGQPGEFARGPLGRVTSGTLEFPRIPANSSLTFHMINRSYTRFAVADVSDEGATAIAGQTRSPRRVRFVRSSEFRPFNLPFRHRPSS